jgi:hypothetical protein
MPMRMALLFTWEHCSRCGIAELRDCGIAELEERQNPQRVAGVKAAGI